jgi:hypothetical protein
MELIVNIQYLGYAFLTGLVIGSGLFCLGLMIGRLQASGGVMSVFRREKVTPLEDVPGTEEYYDKARLAPDDGGHANAFDADLTNVANQFEEDLIDLARHSE